MDKDDSIRQEIELKKREIEYDFQKTLYKIRVNDGKYFEDKALTLINTNSILIIVLTSLLGFIITSRVQLEPLLLLTIVLVITLYFVSATTSLYAVYPRKNKECMIEDPTRAHLITSREINHLI